MIHDQGEVHPMVEREAIEENRREDREGEIGNV